MVIRISGLLTGGKNPGWLIRELPAGREHSVGHPVCCCMRVHRHGVCASLVLICNHVTKLPEPSFKPVICHAHDGYSLKKDSVPGEKFAPSSKHYVAEKIDKGILCYRCRQRITSEACRIEMNYRHQHTFTNPAQFRFTIGCFSSAPGCAGTGGLSSEFSWFSGYQWQVILCSNCHEHLGWKFQSPSRRFYGLILNRLLNPES